MMMNIRGFSTNMFGWFERWKADGLVWDYSDVFRACAEAGIDAVEIDATPEKLELARSYGLTVSASYIGLPLHESFKKLDVEHTIMPFAERLARAGGSDLLLNADPVGSWSNPQSKTESQVKQQGENLSIISEQIRPMGLRVCLHNHAADLHNALADLHSVVKYAESDVGLCVDTGWAHVAGCDPVKWIETYPERLFALHFRNQRGEVPTEDLLEGDLDFTRLLKATAAARYNGWLALELWHHKDTHPTRTMTENVRRSIDYLRNLVQQI
jgi:inosose dehydratase